MFLVEPSSVHLIQKEIHFPVERARGIITTAAQDTNEAVPARQLAQQGRGEEGGLSL